MSKPFYVALSDYSVPNNHLLSTALIRVSYLAFGAEPWVLRLPAMMAGILTIPVSYFAARALFGRSSALLCAALVATVPQLVLYSAAARGYALIVLFTFALVLSAAY
ncbi:MAG TPA: glycosyltransferase family 39 protein, partial [Longimicrobiales bacterium]|nr:glycosyltransferase family 39 protein [Longimicrobiales bacterium]